MEETRRSPSKESVSNGGLEMSLGATLRLSLSGQEVTGSSPRNSLSACGVKVVYINPLRLH
ncbi:hypothetical protein Lal_00004141 [Lupinus albus]|nr:hypothetical protein Lal_00004141 [Lupinus albus]